MDSILNCSDLCYSVIKSDSPELNSVPKKERQCSRSFDIPSCPIASFLSYYYKRLVSKTSLDQSHSYYAVSHLSLLRMAERYFSLLTTTKLADYAFYMILKQRQYVLLILID